MKKEKTKVYGIISRNYNYNMDCFDLGYMNCPTILENRLRLSSKNKSNYILISPDIYKDLLNKKGLTILETCFFESGHIKVVFDFNDSFS